MLLSRTALSLPATSATRWPLAFNPNTAMMITTRATEGVIRCESGGLIRISEAMTLHVRKIHDGEVTLRFQNPHNVLIEYEEVDPPQKTPSRMARRA